MRPRDARNELSPHHRVSDRVWRKNDWKLVERAVAEVIAKHMNKEGVAFPGYKRIADWAGICTKSVHLALKVLVNGDSARGLLPLFTRQPRRSVDGKGRGFIYRLAEKPVALAKGREAYAAKVKNFSAILAGQAEAGSTRIDDATKVEAEELRLEELRLQKRLLAKELPQGEYEKRVGAVRMRRSRLSRDLARLGGERMPDEGDPSPDSSSGAC